MIPGLIIDCSITMAWCFPEERTPAVLAVRQRLANETAITPVHWPLEVINVLLMCEKRGRITSADSNLFLQSLAAFDIEQDSQTFYADSQELLDLGRTHLLTSYDAAYLDLSIRRGLPLATLDKDLRRAAESLGIMVLGL